MSPRAFISFDYDHDEEIKRLFAGQGTKSSPTPYHVEDWSSKVPLPQAQWEALIASKVKGCNLMIVLVGPHAANAGGVAKEIQFAKQADVPFFGVYVNGANANTALPAGLPRNRVVAWTWPNVGSAIRQMMGEGKNQ